MKKINILILLLGVLFFCSCEEQLDEVPVHQPTVSTAVTDYTSAQQLLNGMYNAVVTRNLGANLSLQYSAMGGFYSYGKEFSFNYGELGALWQDFYNAINYANVAVKLLSDLDDSEYPSTDEKKSMIAEARAFRAYNYMNLLYTFCYWWDEDNSPYGLVYRDQMADLTNLQVPRLTVGESYTKIIEDLDEAIANAPDFESSSYLSKQMATVLKAKLLLNRGKGTDYQDALVLVQSVKQYAYLEPDIKEMYEVKSLDSDEVVWAQNILGANQDPTKTAWPYTYIFSYMFNRSGITGFNINPIYARDWLLNDPRFPEISGMVPSPIWWQNIDVLTLTKLVIRGQKADNVTVYFFRWAELYLMEAELIARTGGTIEQALEPVNYLRSARTTVELPPFTASTMEEFNDLLFKEYWLELGLENGSEYFASLRFMKNDRPWIYEMKNDKVFDETNFVAQIPLQELTKNEMIVPNPEPNY